MDAENGHPMDSTPANGERVRILCDDCKEPVTKPAENASNLSWKDAVQNLVATYFARPQMWPFGYILNSTYSPFQLEREMPHHHWRDAFEDLLAMYSGRGMISAGSRKRETEEAARLRFKRASEYIGRLNELLKRDAPAVHAAEEARDIAESDGDELRAEVYGAKVNTLEAMVDFRLSIGEDIRAEFEKRKGWTGSQQKGRGQWMASLITSGAVNGWYARLSNTEGGESWLVEELKSETPDEPFGNWFTERELHDRFVEGIPYQIGMPDIALDERARPPRTASNRFPIGWGMHWPDESDCNGYLSRFRKASTSTSQPIRYQHMEADTIKYPSGTVGTKVTLQTTFMDKTSENKEIMEDSVSVLREVEKARASIEDRNLGW